MLCIQNAGFVNNFVRRLTSTILQEGMQCKQKITFVSVSPTYVWLVNPEINEKCKKDKLDQFFLTSNAANGFIIHYT